MAEHDPESLQVSKYLKIKSWALRTTKAEPKSGKTKTTHSVTIFNVPKKLVDVRRSAFLGEIFTFGSLYRDGTICENMKMRHPPCLFGGMELGDIDGLLGEWRSFDGSLPLRFSEDMVGNIDGSMTDRDIKCPSRDRFDGVLKELIDLTEKARECYEGGGRALYPGYFDFFRRMVVDGCFIIESLRLYNKFLANDEKKDLGERYHSGASIFEARWILPTIQRELIKLENQIPFFILEKLYSLTTTGNNEPPLQDLFVPFFCSMLSLDKSIYLLDPKLGRNYAHPLDLFRSSIIFSLRKKREINEEVRTIYMGNPKLIYSAQDLQEAGIKIIKKDNSSLLDISFDFQKGVLQMSLLSIDESMIIALLNFVAYEQCDQSQEPYVKPK